MNVDSRILRAGWAALQAFLGGVWRSIRQVFHEITGAFFALFTLVGAAGTWREWRQGSESWLLVVPVLFTLMMGLFAVSSFRNARRVR